MNQNKKTLKVVFGSIRRFIVVFGGMAVMVVTTACGLWIGGQFRCCGGRLDYSALFYGGAIGAVAGGLLWGLLGYMVYRKKNAAPNEVIPDDSTT